MTQHSHQTAPTEFVEANGIRFAYRRFGKAGGVPILFRWISTVLRQQIRSCPTGLVAARVDQPPPDQARSALRWKTPTQTTAEFSASRHTRISPYM